MPRRTITLLHVEDDVATRRLLAHHLKAMPEFQFEIRYADAESSAIDAFSAGRMDVVILDYHLEQGNGLNCVRELRSRDRLVPIIAISGVATPEVASELLEAGADDFIEKRHLTSDVLARSLRDTWIRADACRQRAARQKP